jgi:hypothetical protein
MTEPHQSRHLVGRALPVLEEKANSVRYSTPRSAQRVSTGAHQRVDTGLVAGRSAACSAARAQRPLPSMTMAT